MRREPYHVMITFHDLPIVECNDEVKYFAEMLSLPPFILEGVEHARLIRVAGEEAYYLSGGGKTEKIEGPWLQMIAEKMLCN